MAKGSRGGKVGATSSGAGGAQITSTTYDNTVEVLLAQAQRISNPSTKQDFLDRANFIAEVSENSAYNYDVSVSEWQNYGKDRTYIKLNQYNSSDGSLRQAIDMGYYDNVKNEYVKGRTKNSDSMQGNLWNLQGSQKYTDSDIAEFLKNRKK